MLSPGRLTNCSKWESKVRPATEGNLDPAVGNIAHVPLPDSHLARDAFSTFIPISVDSDARTKIIFDFFELLAAIAAHGKTNGLGGRKLSRYSGWWAFEHVDTGHGFEASYKNWAA